MNIHIWVPLGLTGLISLLSTGLSRVFSSTTVWKHQFFGVQSSLWSNSPIHMWPLEKPYLWLYGPLLTKWCLSFFFFFGIHIYIYIFNLFSLEANYFTIMWWFLLYIHMNQTCVYVSPSWTPFLPPSPSHPSGSSQCTSPEHPASCIELALASASHMVIYMFQCYSFKHPTLAFSHRVQQSVLYTCVSFAVSPEF